MLKILFADDSMTAQNMGKKILVDAGYEVIAVSNGAAAAKKLLEYQPDLAILDVHMPGYSGFEVCAKIRAVPAIAKMPVLLTVGKMEPYSVEEGARVKADGVIIKPFEASVLLATVRNLCERAQATRAGQEEFEATMRIEPPKFEEFKDDSYNTWKSETQDSEATAERAVAEDYTAPAMGVLPEAAATPAYAFDQTMPLHPHPAPDPAFAETLPFLPSSRRAPDFPPMTREEPAASTAPAFDETAPAWPSPRQAVVQAAAQAAFMTEELPIYAGHVAEHIDTAKIEPALPADVEDTFHDTQKIVPWTAPAQGPAATLEIFESFTPPVNVEPPAGFEPTILARTQDPGIARDPSLETPLQETGLPNVQAGNEPGLLGNAMEEPTAPGFSTAAFAQAPSREESQAPAKSAPAPEPAFSRPQDIAFDKMVSDLLEREPVPLMSAESNTISTSAIPIPEQPAGFFSKYLALGRADEQHSASDSPTVELTQELTQEFGAQTAVPAERELSPESALDGSELLGHPVVASSEISQSAPEPALVEQLSPVDSKIQNGRQAPVAVPGATEDAPVVDDSFDDSFYVPTTEYSYPEDQAPDHRQEETVESVLASMEGSPAVADPELVAQLAAAFEHIEPAPQAPEPTSAHVSHETTAVASVSSAVLDVETVSLIITRVLDRVMPEIVRMIASELEAEKNYRLQ